MRTGFFLDFLGSWDRQCETFRWSRRFPQTPHPRRGCRWRRTYSMRVEHGWKQKGPRNVCKAKVQEIESFIRDVLIMYIGRVRYTLQWTIWQMVIEVQRCEISRNRYSHGIHAYMFSTLGVYSECTIWQTCSQCSTYLHNLYKPTHLCPVWKAGPFTYRPEKKKATWTRPQTPL